MVEIDECCFGMCVENAKPNSWKKDKGEKVEEKTNLTMESLLIIKLK